MRAAARAAHAAGAAHAAAATLLRPAATALLASVALLASAAPLQAQRVQTRFDDEPEGENLYVEIGKWTSGGLAVAAGAWAFLIQHDAEDRYEALEAFCAESPQVCADVNEAGEYNDGALESRYQDIRQDYRNARWVLIGAHVLAATSVVLFIVDLPRSSTPENVPYEPPALRVGARADGALEATLTYPVSNILTRSP